MTNDAYLDLFKKTLTAYVFPESADRWLEAGSGLSPKSLIKRAAIKLAGAAGWRLVKPGKFDESERIDGRDWPSLAYTMVGLKRLDNIQMAIETVLKENIAGDVVECGVWRGGCSIFMKAVLNSHGDATRNVWCADSFEGLPKPDAKFPEDKDYDISEIEYMSVPLERVKQNFRRFDLFDDRVKFLKGWFKDTLPTAPIDKISILRADGDLYESTMQILDNLYSKVSPGGFVIIDDYRNWPPCKAAVTEFRAKKQITSPIIDIDWCSVYWRV